MTKVLVHPGQGESFTSVLQGEIVVVGRSSDADLQVDDKYLSRKHAKLIRATAAGGSRIWAPATARS